MWGYKLERRNRNIFAGGKRDKSYPIILLWILLGRNSQILGAVVCPFPVTVNHKKTRHFWFAFNRSWTLLLCYSYKIFGLLRYLFWLPLSHCVPLNPGAQLQLNPFTRSVQVPLFLQGWLVQSSISVLEDKSEMIKIHRGYNTVARRYEFYVRVARTIPHE